MSGSGANRPTPPTLRSLDRLGYDLDFHDEDERPPETPPYRRNQSTLTLPPEYLSDGEDGRHVPEVPPMPRGDEKRREHFDGDDDVRDANGGGGHEDGAGAAPGPPVLTLQTSDTIIPIGRRGLGSANATPPSAGTPRTTATSRSAPDLSLNEKERSRGMYEGETLVNPRSVKHPHYADSDVDEHGGLPHAHFTTGGGTATRRSSIDSSRAPSVANTDNEDDEEPDEFYDWSDEEDLVDQEAHFENKLNLTKKKKKGWGPRR